MSTTSTLKQIIEQVVDECDLGLVLSGISGTTTTLTDTSANLATSAVTGASIPVNSWVIITAGGNPGDTTRVANYVPAGSGGVLTVSPAITTGATSAIVLYPIPEMDKGTRIKDAINRALNNRITRWQRMPLTFVPDGDLRGTTVTDYWTGTAATPVYVTPTFPAGGAAVAFGFGGIQRVLQSTTTNATNNVKSNTINLALNSTVTGYQWYFQTAIRVVSGSGNAQFAVWDETNNAQITANVIAGSENFTHTTTSLGFINMEGTVNIPATCKQISFRLISSATTTVIQMTPLAAFPVDAVTFPIPNRIVAESYIGNFYYGTPTTGTSGVYSLTFSEPMTTGQLTHQLMNFGDHYTVTFNFRPYRAVWFDELTYDPELSAMTDTVDFPLDQCVKWTKYELFKMFYYAEKPRSIDYASRVIPVPSRWKTRAIEAKREANNSDYEPPLITVYGRV